MDRATRDKIADRQMWGVGGWALLISNEGLPVYPDSPREWEGDHKCLHSLMISETALLFVWLHLYQRHYKKYIYTTKRIGWWCIGMAKKAKKMKITITLSPENVEYIEKLKEEGRFRTTSAIVEDALTVHRAITLEKPTRLELLCYQCGNPASEICISGAGCFLCPECYREEIGHQEEV